MGAEIVPPYPAFSTTMARATRGASAGAKATNHACALPLEFVAVPVFPATVTPGSAAAVPVPCWTTWIIMARIVAAVSWEIGEASCSEGVENEMPFPRIARTMYGRGTTPPRAMVAATSAMRKGVTKREA